MISVIAVANYLFPEKTRQSVDQVSVRLEVQPHRKRILFYIDFLIIKDIRGGKSGDHLRRITIVEIGVLQIVEKRRIDLPQLDNIDVGRTQNEGTVLPVTPRVPPHGRCQCPVVIGTTLHVVGDLHLGLRAEGSVVAVDSERSDEPRE